MVCRRISSSIVVLSRSSSSSSSSAGHQRHLHALMMMMTVSTTRHHTTVTSTCHLLTTTTTRYRCANDKLLQTCIFQNAETNECVNETDLCSVCVFFSYYHYLVNKSCTVAYVYANNSGGFVWRLHQRR